MDAVRLMGQIVKETAEKTKDADSLGCAKLVVLCNAPDDNPFMAGAFHGVSEDDAIIYYRAHPIPVESVSQVPCQAVGLPSSLPL